MKPSETELPVHNELDVRKSNTIFKSSDWWKAVVLSQGFGSSEVAVYLWKRDGSDWKRKQKLKISDTDEWNLLSETIDSFVSEL